MNQGPTQPPQDQGEAVTETHPGRLPKRIRRPGTKSYFFVINKKFILDRFDFSLESPVTQIAKPARLTILS